MNCSTSFARKNANKGKTDTSFMRRNIQGSSDQRVTFLPPVSTGSLPTHLRNKLGKKREGPTYARCYFSMH